MPAFYWLLINLFWVSSPNDVSIIRCFNGVMRKNVIGFVVGSQTNATTVFPTSDSRFIPDFLLMFSDFRLRTSHFRLQTLNSVYSILEFSVFISDYSLPSSVFGFRTFYFGVRTFDYPFFGILISNLYLGFRTRNLNSDHWRIIFYLPAWHFSWNDDLRVLSLLRLICDDYSTVIHQLLHVHFEV